VRKRDRPAQQRRQHAGGPGRQVVKTLSREQCPTSRTAAPPCVWARVSIGFLFHSYTPLCQSRANARAHAHAHTLTRFTKFIHAHLHDPTPINDTPSARRTTCIMHTNQPPMYHSHARHSHSNEHTHTHTSHTHTHTHTERPSQVYSEIIKQVTLLTAAT
jgi:hypothetical protein